MSKLGTLRRFALLQLPEKWLVRMMRLRSVQGRRIDPKAQLLGEIAALMRGPKAPTLEESRAQMAGMAARLDEPCPSRVTKRDVTLPGADGDRAARVYEPAGAVTGTLLYFHGGGWVQCDLDTHDGLCGKLADQAGVRVISFDYRLAPEHKFPAGLMDCLAAYQALQGGALDVDPTRLIVGGDSAGANLTAALLHLVAETGGTQPMGQLLIYPAVDGRLNTQSHQDMAENGLLLNAERMNWYLDLYLPDGQDRLDPRVSPLLSPHLAGQPPALILVAGHDPLRDDGYAYAEALTSAGAQAQVVEFEGQVHAFLSLTKILPQGNAAIRASARWLRHVLGQ